jgi:hypothetical protein
LEADVNVLNRHLGISALLTFLPFVVAAAIARFGGYVDLMVLVFLAGSVGGVLNNYFRVSKIGSHPEAVAPSLVNRNVVVQFYIAPLISGILALVACGLFMSGVLGGELFPEFDTAGGYTDIQDLLTGAKPKTNADAAKAIFWGFVAGFSEKFVPNVIDKLVARAEESAK